MPIVTGGEEQAEAVSGFRPVGEIVNDIRLTCERPIGTSKRNRALFLECGSALIALARECVLLKQRLAEHEQTRIILPH